MFYRGYQYSELISVLLNEHLKPGNDNNVIVAIIDTISKKPLAAGPSRQFSTIPYHDLMTTSFIYSSLGKGKNHCTYRQIGRTVIVQMGFPYYKTIFWKV